MIIIILYIYYFFIFYLQMISSLFKDSCREKIERSQMNKENYANKLQLSQLSAQQ